MKLKDIFSLKNIKSYLEGHSRLWYDRFIGLPPHMKEQITYRLAKCKDTCVKEGKCKYCGCPPHKKAFVIKSCNEGKIFPDIMSENDWKAFKKKNGIQ